MPDKKIKVLTIGDHPLFPSGVGTQSKYIFEALLNSGKFQLISMGGAMEHPSYDAGITDKYGEDWIIQPVKGYGTQQQVRQMIYQYKPDILWFMTDPRFYEWLWHMEDEIRCNLPMVYYHVWDNFPPPTFNKKYYSSNDKIVSISKVTSDVVNIVSPEVDEEYLPHAVDTNIFKKITNDLQVSQLNDLRKENGFGDKFIFFWNNRNARRKSSGSVVYWFKEVLDKIGKENAILLMHTDVNDEHGQPLGFIADNLGIKDNVKFSTSKIDPINLAALYNMADCTVNVADAEGFGLATLESLACETPIIVTMTGGLQEQVTDGENWFGIGIEPAAKTVIGSMSCPWIYEDRISRESFVSALVEMYNKTPKEREDLGKAGRKHVMDNYNFENYGKRWAILMEEVHEKYGSWDNRKEYKSWRVEKI